MERVESVWILNARASGVAPDFLSAFFSLLRIRQASIFQYSSLINVVFSVCPIVRSVRDMGVGPSLA